MSVTLFASCHRHTDEHGAESHAHEESDEEHGHNPNAIVFTPEQAKESGMEVSVINPTTFHNVLEVSGQLLPAAGSEATVTATMAGIVHFSGKAITEGEEVKGGQALFSINAQPMANGNPAAAAQAELNTATMAYERAKKLANEKIIAQNELEQARQRFVTAQSTAQSMGASSQQRHIAASIGGFVKNIEVKPGDYVEAGQALATITTCQRLQLRADVPERYFSELKNITSAHFRMAYDNQRTYSLQELGGRLVSRGKTSESGSGFVPVIFEIGNQGHLLSGSFAEVYLLTGERSGVMSVPNGAITEAQGLYFVYVQESTHSYRRQEVTLGANNGQRTEITSGIKPGDKVVTKGAVALRLAATAGTVPEGHSH